MSDEILQSIVERLELLFRRFQTCQHQQAVMERLFQVQSEIVITARKKLWLLQRLDDFDQRSELIVLELIVRLTIKLNQLEREREILTERRARLNVEIERYQRQLDDMNELGDTNENQ